MLASVPAHGRVAYVKGGAKPGYGCLTTLPRRAARNYCLRWMEGLTTGGRPRLVQPAEGKGVSRLHGIDVRGGYGCN